MTSTFALKTDAKLTTMEELTERINSIERQRDVLCEKDYPHYLDSQRNQRKISKLTERQDALWSRRAIMVRKGI